MTEELENEEMIIMTLTMYRALVPHIVKVHNRSTGVTEGKCVSENHHPFTTLDSYMDAPVESSSYADKNTVANSLSTSIITNRFLVEAGERPQSMIIHFADIASIHILVLKVRHLSVFDSLTFDLLTAKVI